MSTGRPIPSAASVVTDEMVGFCVEVIDASGVAKRLEAHLERSRGRPRVLSVRCLLVALLCLALDDRPLSLKAATKLLFCSLSTSWKKRLGVLGEATSTKQLLARYRQVRYLFHLALSVMDPSVNVKNRVMCQDQLDTMARREL